MNCSNQKGTIHLDVANPGQVSSPRSINLTLGNPPAHLVVLTGIAMPGWDSQSDLDGAEVIADRLGQLDLTVGQYDAVTADVARMGRSRTPAAVPAQLSAGDFCSGFSRR
jgi:hypothetical protein